MQVMQVTFGLTCASSVGYFSSPTALFLPSQIARWNGLLRATVLLSHVIGSLSSYFLLALGVPMPHLFLLSFITLVLGLGLSFFFPSARQELKQAGDHKQDCIAEIAMTSDLPRADHHASSTSNTLLLIFKSFWARCSRTFSSLEFIVLALCGCLIYATLALTECYIASVWFEFNLNEQASTADANGIPFLTCIMDAIGRSLAALGALMAGYVPLTTANSISLYLVLLASFILFGLSTCLIVFYHFSHIAISCLAYCFMMFSGYALITFLGGMTAVLLQHPEDHPFMLGSTTIFSMSVQCIVLAVSHGVALRGKVLFFAAISLLPIALLSLYFCHRIIRKMI
jgi:Reduced folate carrier